MKRQIIVFATDDGKEPYMAWLDSIRDTVLQDRIEYRVDRMVEGNFGDHHGVGEGVFELRLHFGPGFRVYFARDGERVVVLLLGGTKRKQEKDISQAKQYWRTYKERKK